MSKYDRLRDYLLLQKTSEFILSFNEIEEVLGSSLPASARQPQWWANVTVRETSHVQRNAWRTAGYDAFLISGSRKVRFRKTR
jgi:hypothetical protein